MTHSINYQPYRDRLAREWFAVWDPVKKYRIFILIGYFIAGFVLSFIGYFRVQPSLSELPWVVLAGFIYPVQLATTLVIIWFFVLAYITHRSVQEWLEHVWSERQRKKRPNASFAIPFWPFFSVAFLSAAIVFLALTLPVCYMVFWLPDQFRVVEYTLGTFIPID